MIPKYKNILITLRSMQKKKSKNWIVLKKWPQKNNKYIISDESLKLVKILPKFKLLDFLLKSKLPQISIIN